jgi:hypothetical protein
LGNYHRWDSKAQHEKMLPLFGQYQGKLRRTFDTYNDVHDMHYTGMHDLIKVVKCGYGKVVDDICREIRFGRLKKSDAFDLVRKFGNAPAINSSAFCQFLGVSKKDLLARIMPFAKPRDATNLSGLNTEKINLDVKSERLFMGNAFNTNLPKDFVGKPLSRQLLTRGYASGEP